MHDCCPSCCRVEDPSYAQQASGAEGGEERGGRGGGGRGGLGIGRGTRVLLIHILMSQDSEQGWGKGGGKDENGGKWAKNHTGELSHASS